MRKNKEKIRCIYSTNTAITYFSPKICKIHDITFNASLLCSDHFTHPHKKNRNDKLTFILSPISLTPVIKLCSGFSLIP